MPQINFTTTAVGATAHNILRSDLEKQFGTQNISGAGGWADKDNLNDPVVIATAIDYAQTLADRRINLRAAELRAPIPVIGSPFYSGLQDFETTYAGIQLYMGRGEPVGSGAPTARGSDGAGPYQGMLDKAEEQLAGCLIANRELLGQTGTFQSAPVPIGSGSNQALIDQLPLQPFGWRLGCPGYGRGW